MNECLQGLSRWQQLHVHTVGRSIEEKSKALKAIQEKEDAMDVGEMQKIKWEITSLLDKEEQIWRQKSKVLWLKEGD